VPAPAQINVPQRADGPPCPNGSEHSRTDLRRVDCSTRSLRSRASLSPSAQRICQSAAGAIPAEITQINASLARPHGGRVRAEAEAVRPVGCIGLLGRCPFWRTKSTPRFRSAPPLTRPQFDEACKRQQHRVPPRGYGVEKLITTARGVKPDHVTEHRHVPPHIQNLRSRASHSLSAQRNANQLQALRSLCPHNFAFPQPHHR